MTVKGSWPSPSCRRTARRWRAASKSGPRGASLAAAARACLLAGVLLTVAGRAAGEGTVILNPAPDPQHPLVVPISRAIMALGSEAHAAWDHQKPWPREQCDMAARQAVQVVNDDLVRVLARRLDPVNPIDAYIRWQLLSFQPDLTHQPADTYHRLIAVMPDVKSQPVPALPAPAGGQGGNGLTIGLSRTVVVGANPTPGAKGATRPTLGVVTSGVSLGTGAAATAAPYDPAQAQNDLAQAQDEAARANASILAYRDGLIRRLPSEGGARVAAMIADLISRLKAGDDSASAAAGRLLTECQTAGPTMQIDPALHAQILGGLRTLAGLHTTVVRRISSNDQGQVVAEQVEMHLPPEALGAMVRSLKLAEEFVPKP